MTNVLLFSLSCMTGGFSLGWLLSKPPGKPSRLDYVVAWSACIASFFCVLAIALNAT